MEQRRDRGGTELGQRDREGTEEAPGRDNGGEEEVQSRDIGGTTTPRRPGPLARRIFRNLDTGVVSREDAGVVFREHRCCVPRTQVLC